MGKSASETADNCASFDLFRLLLKVGSLDTWVRSFQDLWPLRATAALKLQGLMQMERSNMVLNSWGS